MGNRVQMLVSTLGSGAAVLFGVLVLFFSMVAVTNPTSVSPHQDASSGAMLVQKIDYYLPYPGLLPDSALYKFKAARDRVSLMLIFNEESKVRKELLYADKRINAALVLLEGGKADLAVTTATKAEKYLENAISRTGKLMSEGIDVKSLLLVLGNAAAKHEELLVMMSSKLNESGNNMMQQSLEMASLSHERVDQLMREAK